LNWAGRDGQKSASPIELVAGGRYYFEILHKQAEGADYLAVAWQIPGRQPEIIEGEYLSPFGNFGGLK